MLRLKHAFVECSRKAKNRPSCQDWSWPTAPQQIGWGAISNAALFVATEGKMIWHYDHDTALFMIRNRLNFKPIHNDEYDKITPLLDSMLLSLQSIEINFEFSVAERDFNGIEEQ